MEDGARHLQFSRRSLLGLVGATALAGCSSSTGQQTPSRTDRPTETTDVATTTRPTATSTPEPLGARYDLALDHDRRSWAGFDPEWTAPTDAPPALDTEVLIENLEIPWDLSFAPDGTLFISERVGRVLAFDGEETSVVATPADAIDAGSVAPGEDHDSWWVPGGEGGTLGVAAHPSYPDPPLVYVYYTAETGDGPRNRVVAFDTDTGETAGTLVADIPASGVHNGGRITFGPANYLWVTCGDAGESEQAQDPATLHGTVLRLTPAGEPAPDNPGLADPRVFTYGHRNPQGITWLPDGTTLVTEHGPDGRDEVNRLEAGANYGWPDTRRREAYPDASVHRPLANSGKPSWAPTGAVFYTGEAVPSLHNRLLVGGLWSQRLTIGTLTPPDGTLPPVADGTRHDGEWSDDAYTATTYPALEGELGRIRHVEQGPDGTLYALTSNRDGRAKDPFPRERDDVLVRLTAA